MRLLTSDIWDDIFFQEMLEFKDSIHKNIATSFPETLEDYFRFFSPESPFAADFGWRAFLVKDNSKIMAKAILCWRRGSTSANLGFIDWLNKKDVAAYLVDEVARFARGNGITSIKTPVDMNFFVKYRIRLPGGSWPLYGEPIYPDYYHDLFRATGFIVTGQWDTYQVKRWEGVKDFFRKRRALKKKHESGVARARDNSARTTVRCVRMKEWDNELRIIYDLFSGAYKHMLEYEPISFEQFRLVYDDFRYIINPLYSYIVELKGRPVGFCINYVDPLPILISLKGKRLSKLEKALVFIRLRLNNGTYMIAHVGKIPGPNGEEIKGVQIQVSRWISLTSFFMRRLVVTFQNVNSPSRRTWNPDVWVPHASYVLYGKEL